MCNRNPQDRDFKGIWIPKKIYFDQILTWTEKILLVEIDSLDNGQGCYASNDYLADFLQVSRDWLKHLLSSLKDRSLIVITEENGQRRIRLGHSISQSNHQENSHDESGDEGEIEVPPGSDLNLTARQETDILTVYEFWNSYKDNGNKRWHTHTKVSYSIRLAISQALKKHSVEDICQAIANYALILQSDDHYWTHEYTLNAFLSAERSNGDKKWIDFIQDNFDEIAYRGNKIEDKSRDDTVVVPQDDHPGITEILIKMYRNMTNSQRFEPSPKQQVQFIEAAAMLVKFFSVYPTVGNNQRFRLLRRTLERKYIEAGETLNVGNLCSKYTWDTLMPQLMRELGYIE